MIVVDASTIADFLIDEGERGSWAVAEVRRGGALTAPQVLDYEVSSALRRRTLAGELESARSQAALEDLLALGLRRYPARRFLPRMWELRDRLTAYDASYVALAEALDCPLVTSDLRLARSHGHDAEIRSPV